MQRPIPTRAVAKAPIDAPGIVRYPLKRKLVWWTVLMVISATLICASWLNYIARQAIGRGNAHNVELLGQTLAASFAGRLDLEEIDQSDARSLLDTLELDPRLAFVALVDRHDEVIARRVTDAEAYGLFFKRDGGEAGMGLEIDRPIFLGEQGDLVVCKVPILNPPVRNYGSSAFTPQNAKLEGFVVVALREYELPRFLASLQTSQLLAAGVVCLLGTPVIILAARKLTSPLQQLVRATRRLAEGAAPEPVRVRTGDEISVLAESFNDMATKLFATQQQLVEANESLEEKVRQRTDELEQTNQRLQNAMHAKDEFLRAVSHDLGTPLRNIDGMAKMLLMKHSDALCDEAQKKLERITANVKAQTDLIADLLELSRIRTIQGKHTPVDVQQLVEQLRNQLEYDLNSKGISLEIESPLPTIVADHNRVRQIFQNLLDNAAKYMNDDGERRITVGHEVKETAYVFSVSDTGPGIAEKDQSLVFHVFRRGTHSGASKAEGRGVGLASVKAIIETYNGQIWVQSRLGEGTTFYFTLDRRIVDPQFAAATRAEPADPAPDEHAASPTAG